MPPYRVQLVEDGALEPPLRAALGRLLAANLSDGDVYLGGAVRLLAPAFRAVAFEGCQPVGHAAGFFVGAEPDVGVLGLGDVAVDPAHRRHGLARVMCRLVTEAGWARGASVALAKTRPLRRALAELGYRPVTGFAYWYLEDGACVRHPDWMAAVREPRAARVRLLDGDF